MSVCPFVRLSVCPDEISETIKDRLLRFGMQIPELLTHCKFVSAMCNAHKPPKTVAPTVLMQEYKF